MISYRIHRGGRVETPGRLDPGWLRPGSGVVVWADIQEPGPEEARLLAETFGIHPLAVEDALQPRHHPKIESYDRFLYAVLHGIDYQADGHRFDTHDVDFLVAPAFLVTVHDGRRRSITEVAALVARDPRIMEAGPVSLMHRIVDTMVAHYQPEVDELENRLERLEDEVLRASDEGVMADILAVKRDIASLRRVVLPQRDIVGRLARREFGEVDQELAYRFRDVQDQLVRLADDALVLQDQLTGILDAHLATVSNRLGQVSKLLAVIATLFGPPTIIAGLYGMNVPLPDLPGGKPLEFWWVLGAMAGASGLMYALLRRLGLF